MLAVNLKNMQHLSEKLRAPVGMNNFYLKASFKPFTKTIRLMVPSDANLY